MPSRFQWSKKAAWITAASVFGAAIICGGCCLGSIEILRDPEPQIIGDYDAGNGVRILVQANPGEHGWSFNFRASRGEDHFLEWRFFGVGTLKHVRKDTFTLEKNEGTTLVALVETNNPSNVFLIVDVVSLQHDGGMFPAEWNLIDQLRKATGNNELVLTDFSPR
jgi:hypothetical protein